MEAYSLPFKYVIHTVVPNYSDLSAENEVAKQQLYSCYDLSLDLAVKNNIKSIAFPCLGIGKHGLPDTLVAPIAIRAILDFIHHNDSLEKIYIYCFNEEIKSIYDLTLVFCKHEGEACLPPLNEGESVVSYIPTATEDMSKYIKGYQIKRSYSLSYQELEDLFTKYKSFYGLPWSSNCKGKNFTGKEDARDSEIILFLKHNHSENRKKFLLKAEHITGQQYINRHTNLSDILYEIILDTCLIEKDLLKKYLESTYKTISPTTTNNTVLQETINSVTATATAWLEAVKQYEVRTDKKRRKNDTLPRQIEILIRYLQGESFSDIQKSYESVNITRDLQIAKKIKGF